MDYRRGNSRPLLFNVENLAGERLDSLILQHEIVVLDRLLLIELIDVAETKPLKLLLRRREKEDAVFGGVLDRLAIFLGKLLRELFLFVRCLWLFLRSCLAGLFASSLA